MSELFGGSYNVRDITHGLSPAGRIDLLAQDFWKTAWDVPPASCVPIETFNSKLAHWVVEHPQFFGTETRALLADTKKGLLCLNKIRLAGAIKNIDGTDFASPSSGNHRTAAAIFQEQGRDSTLPFMDLIVAGFSEADLSSISKVFQLVADNEATQALDLRGLIWESLEPHNVALETLFHHLSDQEPLQPCGLLVWEFLHNNVELTPSLQALLSGKDANAALAKLPPSRV
jgi:hypothetical protein